MEEVLKTRLKTALVFGIVVIGLLLMGKMGFTLLTAIVMTGGMYEYAQITRQPKWMKTVAIVLGILGSALLLIGNPYTQLNFMVIMLAVVLYTFFIIVMFFKIALPHQKAGLVMMILYPALALILPVSVTGDAAWDIHFWEWSLVLIWISDSGAYLVGRKLGRTKLFERVSPKKTWEGTLGAGLFTLAGGALIFLLEKEMTLAFWLLTALLVWITGTLGDLFESYIKRTFEVKDSGSFLPGHGGFLDRFDSLIMVIPYLCALLWIKHLII